MPRPPAAVGFLLLGACVVVEQPPEPTPLAAQPIAIPLAGNPAPNDTPADAYYHSVLEQMQLAWLGREPLRLRTLLEQHDRPDAPEWTRPAFHGFRGAAIVLEFETRAAGQGRIEFAAGPPALGEPVAGTLVLGPLPGLPVRLPGGGVQFVLDLELADRDALGDTAGRRTSAVITLPVDVEPAAEPVALPFAIEAPAAGSILRTVRIQADLLPGHVLVDGERTPNRRVRLAESEQVLYPRGVEPIRAQPLRTLRNALALGESRYFGNAWLAAHFLSATGPPDDRAAALALLVDRIRLGRPDQARAAMAAAALLAPGAAAVGDRAGWLRWWNGRAAARPPEAGRE